jgi:hypothetical protein
MHGQMPVVEALEGGDSMQCRWQHAMPLEGGDSMHDPAETGRQP